MISMEFNMHNLKHIRTEILKISQEQMGLLLGCTQGAVHQLEQRGFSLSSDKAWRLIHGAKSQYDIALTLEDIYKAPAKETA